MSHMAAAWSDVLSQATVARHKTEEVNVNKVQVKGVVQDKSNKGAETHRYFEASETKAAMLAFTLAVPDGKTRTDYVRCVARGPVADALKALIGSEVEIVGALGSAKNAKTNQWSLQVVVDEVVGALGDAARSAENRVETETKPLPKR